MTALAYADTDNQGYRITRRRRRNASPTSAALSDQVAPSEREGVASVYRIADVTPIEWELPVIQQMANLCELDEGWDGFGAGPIRRDVLTFAWRLLQSIMKAKTPAPHLAPMSHEGLMVEWHQKDIDLEIEIEAPGSAEVWFHDAKTRQEWERSLKSDFSALAGPIDEITLR